MKYSDPFGIQQSSPLSRTMRIIHLQEHTDLFWPEGYSGPNYIASINRILPAAENLAIVLPNAKGANEGTGMLMSNVGAHRMVINNHEGTQLTDLEPGETKYLYCYDNYTEAGEWQVVSFGATTHSADAIALAGPGTAAIGGRLAAAVPVAVTSSSLDVTATDRSKLFVAIAGSADFNLPAYTVGNNFFIGVKNGGSGTVTVKPGNGSTIDGYPNLALAPNESAWVCCSGTSAWYTIGFGRSTEFQFTKLVKDVSAGGSITLSSAEASNKLMQFIGTPPSDVTVVVPSVVGIYYVQNSYAGANSLTLKTATGSGVAMSATDRAILYCDGVNVVAAQSVAVGTNISIVDGSLTQPSISFAADVNTGIYRADVDTFGITSNGMNAALFRYDKSSIAGKFGVGTSDPAVQMHIRSGSAEALRLQGTGAFQSFWNTAGEARIGYIAGDVITENNVTRNELRDFVDGANAQRSFNVEGVKQLVVTKDGIMVTGKVMNAQGQTLFAGLTDNTFNGVQQVQAERYKFINLGTLQAGARELDLALAGTYSYTAAGIVNFTFKNKPPAGYEQTVFLKVINGAANPPNWPTGTKHPKGVKPTLSAGIDLLAIWYDPEMQAHVIGKVWEDYK